MGASFDIDGKADDGIREYSLFLHEIKEDERYFVGTSPLARIERRRLCSPTENAGTIRHL